MHADLVRRYAEPHRAYHVLAHIERCLDELDRVRHLAADPDAIEAALWFHDAIYETDRRDNEERSARLADEALAEAGVDAARRTRIADLILATRHDAPPDAAGRAADERLVADIDLAILGAEPEDFDRYEAAIRREFAVVPAELFRAGRTSILRRFLNRRAIYATDEFRTRYEAQARTNLERSVAAPAIQRTPPRPAPPRSPPGR